MFGWLALPDPIATDWDLAELISCSWRGLPQKRSEHFFESHVVKTTCDLDKSQSPFGGVRTMSWCLRGFSGPPNDARHGNRSGSAISRHQFSAEMLRHKVSMTSLHWQTGLQTEKGHALTQFTLVNEQDPLCMETGFL